MKTSALAAFSSSSALPPPWIELPVDVTTNILQRLDTEDILNSVQKVCSTWWKVCQDPAMWRVIYLRNPDHFYAVYDIMCRRAVDRSQRQLVDLTIDNFGDEELINYIANRSSNLRRLTLRNVIGSSLVNAVKKLHELEELHLTGMGWVSPRNVETIGFSCPNLKSFSYNERWFTYPPSENDEDSDAGYGDENEYPFAIGRSMPHLQHLRLFGNCMRNEGLEAILDGCPLLESLDLRQCYELDLDGDLGKRCREQINDLRLPLDSAGDIEWMIGGPPDWRNYGSFDCFSDGDYDYDEDYDDYFLSGY